MRWKQASYPPPDSKRSVELFAWLPIRSEDGWIYWLEDLWHDQLYVENAEAFAPGFWMDERIYRDPEKSFRSRSTRPEGVEPPDVVPIPPSLQVPPPPSNVIWYK